jgi:hypothetical protein
MPVPDISRTPQVVTLLAVPPELRDASWVDAFFDAITNASFAAGEPRMIQGPDGFPYFVLRTPDPHQLFDAYSVAFIAEEATRKGFGIVLNPGPGTADWVFSYGDIAGYRMTGNLRPMPPRREFQEHEVTQEPEEVMLGAPSEEALPGYVRRVINHHFKRMGIEQPSVLLMHRPSVKESNLVFNVFSEMFTSEEDFRLALGSVSWYLPRHYTVLGVSHGTFPPEAYHPLDAPVPQPAAAAKDQPAKKETAKKEPPKKKPWYRRLM